MISKSFFFFFTIQCFPEDFLSGSYYSEKRMIINIFAKKYEKKKKNNARLEKNTNRKVEQMQKASCDCAV